MWEWFLSLHRRRKFDGASGLSQPLGWPELKAWSELTETPLATHEIRLIETLDDFFIAEERKHRARVEKQHRMKSKGRHR